MVTANEGRNYQKEINNHWSTYLEMIFRHVLFSPLVHNHIPACFAMLKADAQVCTITIRTPRIGISILRLPCLVCDHFAAVAMYNRGKMTIATKDTSYVVRRYAWF